MTEIQQVALHKSGSYTCKENAYQLIKTAILNKRFIVGSEYSQDSLSRELGVSKTPLREALLELQKDGYVAFHRGTGVKINAITKEEAADILEFRMCTEVYAARLAATRATKEDLVKINTVLTQFKDELKTRNEQLLVKLDHAFHMAVVAASHNAWFYKQCDISWENVLRFASMSTYKNIIDNSNVFKEHKAVYDALVERSVLKAERAMKQHLANGRHRLLP